MAEVRLPAQTSFDDLVNVSPSLAPLCVLCRAGTYRMLAFCSALPRYLLIADAHAIDGGDWALKKENTTKTCTAKRCPRHHLPAPVPPLEARSTFGCPSKLLSAASSPKSQSPRAVLRKRASCRPPTQTRHAIEPPAQCP